MIDVVTFHRNQLKCNSAEEYSSEIMDGEKSLAQIEILCLWKGLIDILSVKK